ncbi:MAG TPA: TMEM175 family protein [Homoserinimonas sp.]|nr:TMEM175 family protein [Homoserinimonas sp.]
MPTSRLEAFSDGVLAIIITIMVLELQVPEGHDLASLFSSTGSSLLTYLLSFVYVGIYWTNHHHMLQVTDRITGGTLWANLHLLFWLSLFPFTTAWMDESDLARIPVVVYGLNLLAAAIAYFIMQTIIVHAQGPDSALKQALGKDAKGKLSPVLYLLGVGCALAAAEHTMFWIYIGIGFFVAVAILWLIPDRRIERRVSPKGA